MAPHSRIIECLDLFGGAENTKNLLVNSMEGDSLDPLVLREGENYKYLGILEADKFLEEKMKLNVSKEYIRMVINILKSKLNGGNLVCGVNTWAVFLLRYSAAFVNWRKSELQAINRKNMRLFTIYGALHPKSDVDR